MAEWVTGRRELTAVADRHFGERKLPQQGRKPYRGGGVGGDPGVGASGEAKGDKASFKITHKNENKKIVKENFFLALRELWATLGQFLGNFRVFILLNSINFGWTSICFGTVRDSFFLTCQRLAFLLTAGRFFFLYDM
jgi:hypothetical protein